MGEKMYSLDGESWSCRIADAIYEQCSDWVRAGEALPPSLRLKAGHLENIKLTASDVVGQVLDYAAAEFGPPGGCNDLEKTPAILALAAAMAAEVNRQLSWNIDPSTVCTVVIDLKATQKSWSWSLRQDS